MKKTGGGLENDGVRDFDVSGVAIRENASGA